MWTQEIPWIGRRILMDLWAYKRWTAPVLISFKDPWTIVKSCIKSCCIYHFYHQHPSANVCYIHHKPSGWWYTYPSEKYELVRQLGWFFHSQYDGKVIMAPCSSHHQPAEFTPRHSEKNPSSYPWSAEKALTNSAPVPGPKVHPPDPRGSPEVGPWSIQKKSLVDRLVTHQPKTNS